MNGISFNGNSAALTGGFSAVEAARMRGEAGKFRSLLESAVAKTSGSVSSSQVAEGGRLNGEYTSSFGGTFASDADKASRPVGAAANSALATDTRTIDRTSALYEKSLELESYFVKMMLSSMRGTLSGTSLGGEKKSFAQNMYEDMLYDELAVSMTKNAGFGLADQIYLELA